jgi:LEA14-like dessication related protein
MSKCVTRGLYGVLLLSAGMLSACATVANSVQSPDVSLSNIELTTFSLGKQTFLLGFDVSNSNPFPLPVKSVKYGIVLDGQTFASGTTLGSFSIPASGNGEFFISVDLNLMKTAPRLLSVVRNGAKRDIPYQVEGELGIDIPLIRSVSFKSDGAIRLRPGAF